MKKIEFCVLLCMAEEKANLSVADSSSIVGYPFAEMKRLLSSFRSPVLLLTQMH